MSFELLGVRIKGKDRYFNVKEIVFVENKVESRCEELRKTSC